MEYLYGVRFKKEQTPAGNEDAQVKAYMTDELKQWCKGVLEEFGFVKWDRFMCSKPVNGPHALVCYGWIDRKTDSYKDFILIGLILDTRRVVYVSSSSPEYNEEIGALCTALSKDEAPTHAKQCIRIEDWLDVSNSIKLDRKK